MNISEVREKNNTPIQGHIEENDSWSGKWCYKLYKQMLESCLTNISIFVSIKYNQYHIIQKNEINAFFTLIGHYLINP